MNRQQLLDCAAGWFDQSGLLSAMRYRVAALQPSTIGSRSAQRAQPQRMVSTTQTLHSA